MNKNLGEGDDMKAGKMKIASLIGMLLYCLSTQVSAAVCSAEIERAISLLPQVNSFRQQVENEAKSDLERPCSSFLPQYIEQQEQAVRVERQNATNENGGHVNAARREVSVCAMRARLAQCNSSSASIPPVSGNAGASRSNSTNPASTNSQQTNRLNKELNEAEARAQNNQAKVDRARKGKPKRHVLGAEAHQCMSVVKGSLYGGFVNSCPYAIEYNFCAYHPKKDSWTEAFDCEANKFGAWQIAAGPGRRQSSHTNGAERIYWFACKYGPSLRQPDGISPADIEFQVGRGLLGRCAEWGSGGS